MKTQMNDVGTPLVMKQHVREGHRSGFAPFPWTVPSLFIVSRRLSHAERGQAREWPRTQEEPWAGRHRGILLSRALAFAYGHCSGFSICSLGCVGAVLIPRGLS